jgi:hypothetical protein
MQSICVENDAFQLRKESCTTTIHPPTEENKMTTYEISVFITQELYDYADQQFNDPRRPQYRALDFIEGAVEYWGDHTVNRVYPDKTPDPPYECPDGSVNNSFCGPCICRPLDRCCWNHMYDWWKDWYQSSCKDPHAEAADCNVLLTKAHDCAGRGGGKFAVAGAGEYICELPTDWRRALYNTDEAQAMWITLQEVGHSLIDEGDMSQCDNDGDNDSFSHDSGRIYDPSGWEPYYTPMGVTGDTTENNCCRSMQESKSNINTSTDKGMHYSKCSNDNFK